MKWGSARGAKGPFCLECLFNREGKDEMIKASIDLQDLRRRLYVKAKAETSWRFWGLYVHVCKTETLREAYALAKENDGAPGVDGVTFEAIEAHGVEVFLEQIKDELVGRTYKPLPARRQEIPKDGGKVRVLSIPAVRDRVVQGALKTHAHCADNDPRITTIGAVPLVNIPQLARTAIIYDCRGMTADPCNQKTTYYQ
jgi:RNA-directed DNA polymerase